MKEFLLKRDNPDTSVVQGAKEVGVCLDWEPIDDIELRFEERCLEALPTEVED